MISVLREFVTYLGGLGMALFLFGCALVLCGVWMFTR
jgi:hypothetical protein